MGEIYENIEQYLNGTLQGEELKSFEAKLASDKEFAEEVRQRYILIQAIKEARKAELKQYLKDRVSPSELNKQPMQVRRSFNLYYAAAAASVIIAATVIFLLTRSPDLDYVANKPNEHVPADTLPAHDSTPAIIDNKDHLAQENAIKKVPGKIRPEGPRSRTPDTLIARAEDTKDADGDGVADSFDKEPAYVKNDFEEAVVKRDIRLWDTTLIARQITASSYYNDTAKPQSAEQNRKDSEVQRKKKVYPRTYDRNANTSMDQSERFVYTLEYWQSPINFKGYVVSGRIVRLYGIDSSTSVELLSYQDTLYLYWNNDYYKLEADGKYHEYVKETDPAVLNTLKKN